MPTVPQRIGDYIVGEQLGAGGIGTVYVGTHAQRPSERVALKVLHDQFVEHGQVTARFRREEAAIRAISHPNVVRVLDYIQLPDSYACIMMEHIEGEALMKFMRRQPDGRMHPLTACQLFMQLADGLASAHALGIIHRDLKPANVMVLPDVGQSGGQLVKILDFGIAKAGGAEFTQINTEDGAAIIGTPAYMAPEQFVLPSKVDGRADVYSLGVMLYRCLSSKLPFDVQGNMAPIAECAQYYEMHSSVQPPELPADIPAPLLRLTQKMLAKQPAERPWMNELVVMFRNIAAQLGEPSATDKYLSFPRTEFTNLFSNEGKRLPKAVPEQNRLRSEDKTTEPMRRPEATVVPMRADEPTKALLQNETVQFMAERKSSWLGHPPPIAFIVLVSVLLVWAIVVTMMLVLR